MSSERFSVDFTITFDHVPHRTMRLLFGLSWPRYIASIAGARIARVFKRKGAKP